MNSDPVLLYGATGFTGRSVAQAFSDAGIDVVLSGRNRVKLGELAESLQLPWKATRLDEPEVLDRLVASASMVLNAAGPFAGTCVPLVESCLRVRRHYVDLSGEYPSFSAIERYHPEAIENNVMLMPGAGFVVVPSDCLAVHLKNRMPEARYLRLAFSSVESFSRGTLRAMLNLVARNVVIRRHGSMTTVPVGRLQRCFDFGDGAVRGTAVSWADVITAWHSTGIPNIEVYAESDAWRMFMYQLGALQAPFQTAGIRRAIDQFAQYWPEGPSAQTQDRATRQIVGEVTDPGMHTIRARMTLPDGYLITPPIALSICQRVLNRDWHQGFRTPAQVYGVGLLDDLEGVELEDLTNRG